jgi:hypothetical protein
LEAESVTCPFPDWTINKKKTKEYKKATIGLPVISAKI